MALTNSSSTEKNDTTRNLANTVKVSPNSLQRQIFKPHQISIGGAYIVTLAPLILYLINTASEQFPAMSFIAGWPEMTLVTATLFVLFGLVTILQIKASPTKYRTALKVTGFASSTIFLALAVVAKTSDTSLNAFVPLPSIATSGCFMLLFIALFTTRNSDATIPLFLGLIVLAIAFTRLARLALSGPEATTLSIFDTMALTTTVLFTLSAISAILFNPTLSYHKLFLATHSIGRYARFGILITVALPMFVVVTTLTLNDSQNIAIETSLTLLIVTTITVISSAVYKLLYRLYDELSNNQILQLQLRQSNTFLENFARTASHDLQEPARKVSLLSQLISERLPSQQNDPKLNDAIDRLQTTAKRMNELIAQILQYSVIKPNQDALRPTDLNKVIEEVFETISELMSETGTSIDVNELPVVLGNSTALHQVFLNLIINAIKYRQHDEPADIKIYAERINERYRISIEDNGIGIDATGEKRHEASSSYASYGIGVSATKRVLSMHNSELCYESKQPTGTIASFTLAAA